MMNPFLDVIFDTKQYTYLLNGHPLTSVSKLVNQIKKPFDTDRLAAKKARELGVSAEEIKESWAESGRVSKERGKRVHQHIKGILKAVALGKLPPVNGGGLLALNQPLPEINAFDSFWAEAKAVLHPTWVEWVVGDEDLRIGGTIDVLFFNGEAGHSNIFDWKSGKFGLDNHFQKLLYPFHDLDDCEFNIYSIQLSLYRLILDRNAGIELGDSYIVHLDGDRYEIHQALNLQDRCLEWVAGLAL